jgi:hypothetical protein
VDVPRVVVSCSAAFRLAAAEGSRVVDWAFEEGLVEADIVPAAGTAAVLAVAASVEPVRTAEAEAFSKVGVDVCGTVTADAEASVPAFCAGVFGGGALSSAARSAAEGVV